MKTVYLDCDGTLFDFGWPGVGTENPRWKTVVRRLISAGWRIIINTARCEHVDKRPMYQAYDYVEKSIPEYSFVATDHKVHPEDWNPSPESNVLFIDDMSRNIPLLERDRGRQVVHWGDILKDLKKNNLL